jgi:hypothetical protein
VGGGREAVPPEQPVAVPNGGAVSAEQFCVHRRLQRGQVARQDRQRDTDCGSDSRCGFLADEPVPELQRPRAAVTADAIINAWNDKYHYRFWRPITAIREGDTDGNGDTFADSTWTPLFDPSLPLSPTPVSPVPVGGIGPALVTPPYPDHVSGATTQASASMHAFASFFGTDEMPAPFYLVSSRFPGEHREFTRFSDVTDEIVGARIWAGIHFRNADVQAANLGAQVEQYVHQTQFAFVH